MFQVMEIHHWPKHDVFHDGLTTDGLQVENFYPNETPRMHH